MARNILVIEDEDDHRELLKLIFEVQGFDVDTAANAFEAKSIIDAQRPDAIILDVMLPDVEGWTFCEQLKHNEKTEHIPVMMLSASSQMQPRFEGSCADDMLNKPFDEKELVARVRRMMGD